MGILYGIACKKCKVTRDLDKMYEAVEVDDRAEAVELSERVAKNPFRGALLMSFMSAHMGHDCVFYRENHPAEELYDPYFDNGYKKDTDFWMLDDNLIQSTK